MVDTLAHVLGDGEVIEVRCIREDCPHPLIGRYLAAVHAAHGSEGDEVAHRVRVHEIPEAFELPPGLVSAWEHVLRPLVPHYERMTQFADDVQPVVPRSRVINRDEEA